MTSGTELWGTLAGANVTLVQRWASAWADLQAAGMALYERGKSDDKRAANMFLRRALWESAIASYGRCAVSAKKRNIPFRDFVQDTVGEDGMAVHRQIMDWRHGHVAHRNRAEFESIETVLTYEKGAAQRPKSFNVVLKIDAGPPNDSEFVAAFDSHVTTLRDTLWEQKLFGLTQDIVADLNAGRIPWPSQLRAADDKIEAGWYSINQNITTLKASGNAP
ncbi:hypothetical protein [Mycolicibacterium rhodesiae]|uniref:Uncharacterized protein n=1 Tax=Mycolicibacterium rhodesiae TaxID=36814 RepID=A0A1X0IIX5_MYCRH|nr:hypothetical protein [Mycolicibacterium rhodesiae]MCV7346426.1 hypothetical protein [Mycolicibacterium rhodesiae]ORB47574.1 hypothetical protein BST42_27385 [Mycolicibacterium rhodesiae]